MTNTEIFNKENIVTAHYCDEEYSNVEVLYNVGEETHVYVLPADPEDYDYKALVKCGWDTAEIASGTERYKREQSQDFNAMIQDQVDYLLEESKAELKQQLLQIESDIMIGQNKVKTAARDYELDITSVLYDQLLDQKNNKDNLFKFKLWALELEFVKSSTKADKSRLRKATSVFEGMGIVHELHVPAGELVDTKVDPI